MNRACLKEPGRGNNLTKNTPTTIGVIVRDSPDSKSGQAIPTFGTGLVMTTEKLNKKR